MFNFVAKSVLFWKRRKGTMLISLVTNEQKITSLLICFYFMLA